MPAAEKSQLKKLGILAGSGAPPKMLALECESRGIIPVIVGFEGITEPELVQNRAHLITHFGAVSAMMDFLKREGVTDLVLTGAMKRPAWTSIKPDPAGMKILLKIAIKWLGDDALLKVIRDEFETRGFKLRPIQDFLPQLITPQGVLTTSQPQPDDWETIRLGFYTSQNLGKQDLGQSVIVQQNAVLAEEGEDGTDALIRKAAQLKVAGRGPILVKTCKPQQDKALDLPTVGIKTIQECIKAGFSGIVLQAGDSLLIDREQCIDLCNQNNIFFYGIAENDAKMIAA